MFPTQVIGDDESMPPRKYDTKEKTSTAEGKKEYQKFYMRDVRVQQKEELLKRKNRLGYLESEVARLQKCLEVAQRGCTMP